MNNKRTLEQDYKNLKHLETPDLWSRIEKDLNELNNGTKLYNLGFLAKKRN